ncbi:MAG: sulfite exporter TauE/SafE family protein [Pseudomonadota bacterium]
MIFELETLYPLLALAVGIGTIGGFLSGLLGIGGGLIYVPALFFAFTSLGFGADYAMHIAVGTSLAIAAPTIMTSAYCHYRRESVDFVLFRRWALFLIGGVGIGVLMNSILQASQLIVIFSTVAVIMALYMGFLKDPYKQDLPITGRKRHYPIATSIGFVASMVGISGSMISVPTMTFLNVPIQKAIGTAAALGVVTAVCGVTGFMWVGAGQVVENSLPLTIGYVNIFCALMVVPLSVLMAPYGCKLAHRLPKQHLRRVFALFIACVATRMLLEIQGL